MGFPLAQAAFYRYSSEGTNLFRTLGITDQVQTVCIDKRE